MGARCVCRHKTSPFGKENKREEHKAIDTGRKDQQMPSSFFSLSSIGHNVPEGLRPLCLMDLGLLMLPVVSSSVSMRLVPAEQQRSSTSVPAEQLGEKHRSMLEHKGKTVPLVIPQLPEHRVFREREKTHNCLYRIHYPQSCISQSFTAIQSNSPNASRSRHV